MRITWDKMRHLAPGRLSRLIEARVVQSVDVFYDLRIAHRVLAKSEPSVQHDAARGIGATRSQPTHYWILEKVFDGVELTSEDSFIDIGCAKGRVLAFMLHKKAPCKLRGVELNPAVGNVARQWTGCHDNIEIDVGDVFDEDFNQYTVIYLFNPFLPNTYRDFVGQLEEQLKHPITMVCCTDYWARRLLRGRRGWTMLRSGAVYKIHHLRVAGCPQGWSVWRYEPSKI